MLQLLLSLLCYLLTGVLLTFKSVLETAVKRATRISTQSAMKKTIETFTNTNPRLLLERTYESISEWTSITSLLQVDLHVLGLIEI